MYKKILTLLLGSILSISLLVGCSNSNVEVEEITIQEQAKEEYIQLQYYYNKYLNLALEYNECKEYQEGGYTLKDKRIEEIRSEMEIIYNEFCDYAFYEGNWNLSNEYSKQVASDMQCLLLQYKLPESSYMAVPNGEYNVSSLYDIESIEINFELLLEAIQLNDFTNYRGKHYRKAQENLR